MFILLWLPYTVVLLFGQYIQKLNAFYILRRWKLGLIAFLDAYYSPFNAGHQYWIGILLLARCILLLVFAANPSNNPSVNLLATVTVATVLLTYTANLPHVQMAAVRSSHGMQPSWMGSVYQKWYLSILESSFIFILLIFASATFYVESV